MWRGRCAVHSFRGKDWNWSAPTWASGPLASPGSSEPVSACTWGSWQPQRWLAPEEPSRFSAFRVFNPSSSALSDLQNLYRTQALFLLHNCDVNCSFIELPQFSVPLALLAPASRFQESQSKNRIWLFLSFLYALVPSTRGCANSSLRCTCGTRTVSINFCMNSFDLSLGRCCLVSWGFVGCFTSTVLTTGWTCAFTTCSMVRWILSWDCLQLVLCVLNLLRDFRDFCRLLRHLCCLHVDDLFNDSFQSWLCGALLWHDLLT